eukprot:CAMPEP_0172543980 /NCGR_PEP_ID=MMETSP1067-20121228/14240_1 /TAXON_ID=265564 ORGANISM="Thalassiosira punctigera, Strain Tpunct2005C2" /NCGR_SAMPLE_ID=MMETSP1067 /ASSEMBLY_ACC=CAM_ASM_000444 /LENGTH=344 /DNA_ID=CAMNT_0013330473 /DNA_START=186 /DNA_END=1220 /DNA_ORIENTATION=+
MSLRNLNSPPLVAAAGAGIAVGLPMLDALLSSSASLTLLKSLNVAAFAANVVAVSVPGRLDGRQDDETRGGNLDPRDPDDGATSRNEGSPLAEKEEEKSSSSPAAYALRNGRTLVDPSGWAFAIWGPIYLGEAAFAAAQFLASDGAASALLPRITAPFVAANLFQSLWCASFRPSYFGDEGGGWEKYVSAGALAGAACSLSLVHSAGVAATTTAAAEPSSTLSVLLAPLTMHFGWTTAATLVNLNGSLASDESSSCASLVALGHSSAVAATALGVGLTLSRSAPAYGLTLAWALAACADGMAKRNPSESPAEEATLAKAADAQRNLCWAGSFACAIAAAYAGLA